MTNPLFLSNTYLFAILTRIIKQGTDENGSYFVPATTIFYPKGGGQPSDMGWIFFGESEMRILAARYAEDGIRHYVENLYATDITGTEVAMRIDQETRRNNAAWHTAGHWLSQLVCENLELSMVPIKAHHYPGEGYVEFSGEVDGISPETIDQLKQLMMIDRQANLKINTQIVETISELTGPVLLPSNFVSPEDKPLRFTQIEGYAWIPCGGTHTETIREIKSVTPLQFAKKNGKIRLTYQCEVWDKVYS